MTKEEIAQWVIDNRYPKSENLKTSDFEIYHFLTAQIGIIESENERLKAEMEWISVETELPKNGQWIDVWQPETAHYRSHRITNHLYKRSRRNTFSHWMPVPTEPKK